MNFGMEHKLKDKMAVVTGGGHGIGKWIAKELVDLGAKVVITGRQENFLKDTAKELGELCHELICDQRDQKSIKEMAHEVISSHGAPDILVNNAGCWTSASVQEMDLETWNQIIETNLTGVFLTTQAFLPGMIAKERGDILMISSMSGKKGDPFSSAYNASKFGLQGFSQALMYEVRGHNIRVSVLNPSSVDKSDPEGPPYGKGLHLHAKDIAATVAHLCTLPGRTMIRDMDIYGTNP